MMGSSKRPNSQRFWLLPRAWQERICEWETSLTNVGFALCFNGSSSCFNLLSGLSFIQGNTRICWKFTREKREIHLCCCTAPQYTVNILSVYFRRKSSQSEHLRNASATSVLAQWAGLLAISQWSMDFVIFLFSNLVLAMHCVLCRA